MADRLLVPFGSSEHRGGKRGSLLLALPVCAALLSIPAAAAAQSGEKKDSVGADTVDAITQPLSDLNLRKKDIPSILRAAELAPYDLTSIDGCSALSAEIERLEGVLGPDADVPPDEDGIVNKGLKLGGNVLGGLVPFRGLVRQISGANAARARWQAAIYAGVARRSFLKGYRKGLGCINSEPASELSATTVLGLESSVEKQSSDPS